MGFIYGIALLLCGVLAASSVIIKSKPEAKQLIDNLEKIQGWMGVITAIWGVWELVASIICIGWIFQGLFFWWLTYLVCSVISILVGCLLGYGLIQQYLLSKVSEDQKKKADDMYQKLVGIKVPLGFASIIVGLWVFIAAIFQR